MPYPKFDLDGFSYIIENIFPFLFLIAFQAMNVNTVRAVVTEKEKRIKVRLTYYMLTMLRSKWQTAAADNAIVTVELVRLFRIIKQLFRRLIIYNYDLKKNV